jgi:alpha-methylacyl-CoA racemase
MERGVCGTAARVAPALRPSEAALHPHAVARGGFSTAGGILQPGPVPKFSRTPSAVDWPPGLPGPEGGPALERSGVGAERIAALRASGVLY